MSLILAMDISTRCGWACGRAGRAPDHGEIRLPAGIAGHGAMGAALLDAMSDLHAVQHFDRIVVEAPLPPQAQTHANTARIQLGLAFLVEVFAYRRSIPIREAPAHAVRKAMIGTARVSKDEVVAWCRGQGWEPRTHNEADALCLWSYAQQMAAPRRREAA